MGRLQRSVIASAFPPRWLNFRKPAQERRFRDPMKQNRRSNKSSQKHGAQSTNKSSLLRRYSIQGTTLRDTTWSREAEFSWRAEEVGSGNDTHLCYLQQHYVVTEGLSWPWRQMEMGWDLCELRSPRKLRAKAHQQRNNENATLLLHE